MGFDDPILSVSLPLKKGGDLSARHRIMHLTYLVRR